MSAPVHVVKLREREGVLGRLPAGETYRLVLPIPGRSRDEAIVRAFRALERDHPDENPLCWEVAEAL